MNHNIAFTAPHYGAADIAFELLESGASAIDAMVAAAAAISVLYPHMNSLGGDGFWLIHKPGQAPVAIDACGTSAQLASKDFYKGQASIPTRGGSAAITMAGTLDGWRLAREWQTQQGMTSLPLSDLLQPAIQLATKGIEVTESLEVASNKVQADLAEMSHYQHCFCPEQSTLKKHETLRNPGLANFLKQLADKGIQDFYQGELAHSLSDFLKDSGSPIRLEDFNNYQAQLVTPLSVNIKGATLYNLPAPTQGIASLLILAIYDQLCAQQAPQTESEHTHLLVEATKQAFIIRDREVTDPSRLSPGWNHLLSPEVISQCVANIDRQHALPWPHVAQPGDTVWMGAMDKEGCMVSFIQSIYWEFGSGLVHPDFGLVWNNRGISFSLDPEDNNFLGPGLKPFHTLNPAFATFDDGRRLSYGTMGGEGQPQTQAALLSRYYYQGFSLEESISRGRWLLGRTWGDSSHDLKLEADLSKNIGSELTALGHEFYEVPPLSEMMGHAGAICSSKEDAASAACDPRSDGKALSAKIP